MMDRGFRDIESSRDLAGREHSSAAQPFIAAQQFVGPANERDLLQVERFALPCLPAAAVQDLGDLAVAMMVEKTVDLGDEFRLELANLRDGQWPIEDEAAGAAACQPHTRGDLFGLEQGHVFDEQTQNALSLGGWNARVLPDLRELRGKIANAASRLLVQNSCLVLASPFVSAAASV
jgi:hypothetical protein